MSEEQDHEFKGELPNSPDDGDVEEVDAIWHLSLADIPFKVWLGLVGVLGAIIGGTFHWLANVTVDSLNNQLSSLETQITRQEASLVGRLNSIEARVNDATQVEIDISDDMTEIRERLSRIEAQAALSNEILFKADRASIERDFLPILSRAPDQFFMGGAGEDATPVEEFEEMVLTVPFPRTVTERDEAIELLTKTHRELLEVQARPTFDEAQHSLELSARQVLLTDGTIRLELTSRVIQTSQ